MRLLAELAVLVLAAGAMAVCVALTPRGPVRSGRRRATVRPVRPAPLIDLERLVVSATASQVHAHAYLRPLLAEIAAQRLSGQGYTLTSLPEHSARGLLGDALWEFIAPGRPFPADRRSAGVSERQLAGFLEVLEGL